MPTCIYCTEEKPLAAFDREHVVPKAFGRFRGALTLSRRHEWRVCKACNGRLGSSLDLGLARDSMEATLRVQRGLVPASDLETLGYGRVVIGLPPEHSLAPLLLRFVPGPNGTGISTAPIAQLRLAVGNGPLHCIPEGEIAIRLPPLLAEGAAERIHIFWWSGDPSAPERVRVAAEAAGLTGRNWNEMTDASQAALQRIEAKSDFTIDGTILRAIAKIAFEYFVWACQPSATHLLKHENMKPVREFVADGVGKASAFVRPTNDPILADETPTLRRTRGHLLTLRWGPGREGIVVSVGLFNDLVYVVRVCDPPSVIWQNIECGHHFDLSSQETSKLARGRLIVPPQGRLPRR